MLGLSFGELLIIAIVGVIVVGPRNLPTMLRTAGRWVGKARRFANELREQSGFEDLTEIQQLRAELDEFRALASGSITADALKPKATHKPQEMQVVPDRAREYPTIGCDAYGALPDDATAYLPETVATTLPTAGSSPAA